MANANDDYDDASIELDKKRKVTGNIYAVDKMANAGDDYDELSIAPDTEQIGYLYCNEKEDYYSTLDYTQGKLTNSSTPSRIRGISKDVSNELTEKGANTSKQCGRVNRNLKCNHNASIVKTQRTIIKLVITFSFAIVVITVASSAFAVVKIKQVHV